MAIRVVLAALAAVMLCQEARAGFELNGSFEQPFVSSDNGYQVVHSFVFQPEIPKWTAVGDFTVVSTPNTLGLGPASNADQFLALGQLPPNSGGGPWASSLSQTIATTVGQTYQVSFDYSNYYAAGPASFTMQLSFGGIDPQFQFLASSGVAGNNNWATFTTTFTAASTAASTAMTIGFFPTHTDATGIALLDNVSVIATPEPASIAMAACGVAGLIGWRFRRRAATVQRG